MNIFLLSIIEALGICVIGLMIFMLFLFIPTEGFKLHKEFRFGADGFCIRVEREKEKNKE